MLQIYFQLLKNRNFSLLWLGQIISQFGERLTQMALVGLVYHSAPGSPFTLAKIFSLAIIPVFLVSPVAGVYVDRWNKQKTLYFSDFFRALLLCLIPFLYFKYKTLTPVYLLIFLSFCLARLFLPAKMSIIPILVKKERLLTANSMISLTSMIAAVLGLGLGGVLVEKWGSHCAFYLNASTFLISALFLISMRINEKSRFKAHDILDLGKDAVLQVEKSVIFEVKQGLKHILHNPDTRYAVSMKILLFAILGSLYTTFIVFVQNTFSTITKDLGWLSIGAGVGLFIGTVVYGKIGLKWKARPTLNLCLILFGIWLMVFTSILTLYPSKIFALFSCLVLGVLAAPLEITINTLIHKEAKSEFLGRIFSSLEVLLHLAFILFMFTSAYFAEKSSPFTIIIATSIIIISFSLIQILLNNKENDKIRR